MEEKNKRSFWVIVLVISLLLSFGKISSLKEENGRLQSEVGRVYSLVQKLRQSVSDANEHIDEAKSYAWESYRDMGDALDSLETVEYY